MFSDSVSFNGGTRVEVIAVLANCGRDTDKARRALVTWIRHKQEKGRTTEHILIKLRDIESKFIKDTSLHSAFRDARAETCLPRAPDLPLPSAVRRHSVMRVPNPVPPIVTIPNNVGPSTVSSLSAGPFTHMKSQISRSQEFSQWLESHGNPNTTRRASSESVTHVPQYRAPRIQIPRNHSLQPGLDSPTTSSPEEPGPRLRYRYRSDPVGPPFQFHGLPTPPSTSPPEFPLSPISARMQMARAQSQRTVPNSVPASSSEESILHFKYRPLSASPSLRRVTPPRTNPPDLPLPPIPSDDQDVDMNDRMPKNIPRNEHPPTPIQSPSLHPSSPARPLPIQPIPSPVLSSDESEYIDAISGNSTTRQQWPESTGALLLSGDVVRQDSPVFVLQDNHTSQIGIGPPPPYVDQLDAHSPLSIPTFGETLDRALCVCGNSAEVRLEVAKCIGFQLGYEPPYWQTRLQAAGLHAEPAKYLVDEMSKQVDWSTSFGKTTGTT